MSDRAKNGITISVAITSLAMSFGTVTYTAGVQLHRIETNERNIQRIEQQTNHKLDQIAADIRDLRNHLLGRSR